MASTLLGETDRFPESSNPLAVVVAPTRELAVQVRLELEWVYAPAGAKMAACVGGMDMRQERRALANGAHIVVGTPGRLRDHITRGSLDMSSVRALVLDEADEMLDLGFREDLEFILKAAPPERRTLLFSATVQKPSNRSPSAFRRTPSGFPPIRAQGNTPISIIAQLPLRRANGKMPSSMFFAILTRAARWCSAPRGKA